MILNCWVVISDDTTLDDIFQTLDDKKIIPKHVTPHLQMYYDSWKQQPLQKFVTLSSIGVTSLSTLFLRTRVPGGANTSGESTQRK